MRSMTLPTNEDRAGDTNVRSSSLDPFYALNGIELSPRVAIADAAHAAALTGEYLIAYTTLTAARTVTLPTAVGNANRVYIIKDESGNAATFNITVATSGGNIDGVATKVLNTAYGVIRVYSNGTNWFTF